MLAAAVVVAAGIWLTRSVDTIAELTGLGRLLIGSVLLAGMTSLPELAVGVSAVRTGLDDIALGNLVGSSLFNLLILAVLDLSTRSRRRMLSRAAAAHALSATMSVLLTALVALAILAPPVIRATLGPLGLGSVAVMIAWLLGVRMVFHDQQTALAEQQGGATRPPRDPTRRRRLARASTSCLAAAAVIFVASPFVPAAADSLADMLGLSETFVGTTLVALSTSLPEMATSAAAVRLGAFDLALGNIFGSNAFNMAMVFPLDLVSSGPLLAGVADTHAITCCWAIVVTAIAVVGQLYRIEKRIALIEPDAFLMLLVIAAALATSYVGA